MKKDEVRVLNTSSLSKKSQRSRSTAKKPKRVQKKQKTDS